MKTIEKIKYPAVGNSLVKSLKAILSLLVVLVCPLVAQANVNNLNSLVSKNLNIEKISFQERKITGVVKDEQGNPIFGANVLIKDTTIGTATDFDGKFELNNIPDGSVVITISYQGFATQEQEVDFATGENVELDINLREDALGLDEVVVTGATNPRKKIESSVAITTVGVKEIEERVVRNSADLLKAVPGLWVESSGGDGPGNVSVRGFPAAGYTFVGVMEDGLPVVQAGYVTTISPDQFFKADATLKRVEAIRGGTAPIVMQGAAGAVINNITKTGSENFQGLAKATYSPVQDLYRMDLNLGGPVSDNLYYNVGGFLRSDVGVYDYGYAANKGGQFKGNLLKTFEKGSLKLYTKYINDNVNWNLPTPYIFKRNGDLGEIPGFDIQNDGSAIGKVDTEYSYTLPSGRTVSRDLKDGFSTNLISGGLQFKYDLGNRWTLKNNFRIDDIKFNTDLDISVGISELDPDTDYYYTDGTQVQNVADLNRNGLGLNGVIANGNAYYRNIIDRLEFTKFGDKNSLSLGFEFFNFKINNEGSSALILKEVTNAPRLLIAGNPNAPALTPTALLAPSGVTRSRGDENTYSFFVTDEYTVSDKLRIDAGFRYDYKSLSGTVASREGSPVFAGGSGFVLGDDIPFEDSRGSWVLSAGLNYKFNENFALFARGSRGYNGIKVGDYTADGADIENLKSLDDRTIYQFEGGLKYNSPRFAIFSSLIYAKVNDLIKPLTIPAANGTLTTIQQFVSSRTISAEIEAFYRATDNLSFRLISTVQDPIYTDLSFVAPEGTIVEGQEFDWSGNVAERVPKFTGDLTASYNIKKLETFLGVRYYSSRWSTQANNVLLEDYSEFYLGAGYQILNNLKFSVTAANLFSTVALEEGNTRGDQFLDLNAADGTPRLGRRNLPFTVFTNLAFNF